VAKKKPVGIIVRRGAARRFESLKQKTADLPVVVSWDRRTADRRASSESPPDERRANDRRKAPPFTWETADFVVVEPAQDDDAIAAQDEDAMATQDDDAMAAPSAGGDAKTKSKRRK
jgi:hypothetical protein